MSTRTFLALVGSPRPRATSAMLAQYVADGLAARGWQTQTLSLAKAVRKPDAWPALVDAFRDADVVGLFVPLYVDSLPAEATLALERLVAVAPAHEQGIFALVNCGFLEAEQNDTALAICRHFARQAGRAWLGSLALGGGGALYGQNVEKTRGMMPYLAPALEETVAALDAGTAIPEATQARIRTRFCPPRAYAFMAGAGMFIDCLKHRCLRRIFARPYAVDSTL
jgi:hypothetical protein